MNNHDSQIQRTFANHSAILFPCLHLCKVGCLRTAFGVRESCDTAMSFSITPLPFSEYVASPARAHRAGEIALVWNARESRVPRSPPSCTSHAGGNACVRQCDRPRSRAATLNRIERVRNPTVSSGRVDNLLQQHPTGFPIAGVLRLPRN